MGWTSEIAKWAVAGAARWVHQNTTVDINEDPEGWANEVEIRAIHLMDDHPDMLKALPEEHRKVRREILAEVDRWLEEHRKEPLGRGR